MEIVEVFPCPGDRSISTLPGAGLELLGGLRCKSLAGGCAWTVGCLTAKPFAVLRPFELFGDGVTRPPPSELSPGLD